MKLSTRSRYGLKALYELVKTPDTPIPIKAIANRQDISEAYLEQLFSLLKKANIVKSVRGSQGGYFLSEKAEDISIKSVLTALEGSTNIAECLHDYECDQNCDCASRTIFVEIQNSIDNVLEKLSLKDMIK